MSIKINVVKNGKVKNLYRAYAQVWGKNDAGIDTPACWIGGMTPVTESNGVATIELELNTQWLALALVSEPITLKEVVIQETSGFIPLSQIDKIDVQLATALPPLGFETYMITKEMRQGKRILTNATDLVANPKVILIHGYCSAENPWSKYASNWQNAAFYLNPNSNIGNQEFATKVYNYALTNGITSYGIVGHSQGGMVGLHLLNYYDTGLDNAQGSKLIQSLGTPFKGCSAAGSAADLGKLFGVGCGSNTDLSTDGAKLWLAGISSEYKKEVSYYTTTYEQGKFFGDWCNLAMNALLEWPNDGTCEVVHASLEGATNMGNTQKQCHTTGMGYSAQYYDQNRNKQMSAAAAR